jgi:hypothetical protein
LEPLIDNESLPLGSSVADLREKFLECYDGYSWDGKTKVLNPWSVLNFFDNQMFDNFWFESGAPTFLVNIIKERQMTLDLFNHDFTIITDSLNNVDVDNYEPIPLMFQTGYLTVDQIESDEYRLVFPNFEIKNSFFTNLLSLNPIYMDNTNLKARAKALHKALSLKNVQDIEAGFDRFLSSVNNQLPEAKESYYQNLFMFAMALADQSVKVEETSSEGFLVASVDIPAIGVFIIEIKYLKTEREDSEEKINDELNKLSFKALRQIYDKEYADLYCDLNKKVYKMALVVYKSAKVKAVIEEIG